MNLFVVYQYIYLIFFILLGIFQTTSSAALQHTDIFISLYNSTDKIAILESGNFSSTVYHSNTAWVVEFYASWCGHCQTYANTYREIGIDTWAWRSIVRIGAINCYGGDNTNICREHNVRGYPTILLIPPHADYEKKPNMTSITAMNAKDVQKEIVKQLENLNRRNQTWPRFTPVNRLILEELYVQVPKSIKFILIVVERRDDFTGRQVMLDFSDYRDQITIFRTTTDGKLWRKFHVNLTDVPALFLLHRNRTIERIDSRNHSANMAYRTSFTNIIHEKNLIKTVTDPPIKDMIDGKTVLEDAQLRQQVLTKNENITDEIRDQNTVHKKVNMIDLELALSYMFRQEIPQLEDIRGEAYDALVQWLTVLTKYFPGRQSVMKYLKYVSSKVHAHSKGLNGNEFREIIDKKTSNAFLPNITQSYQHCSGSAPQYRGYPCALWLLFHTLTVSQYKTAMLDSETVNVKEIPMAIQSYVKYFFACRQCSENFMKETSDINRLDLNNQYEAILYLWKVHNHVNQRLRYEVSEDPQHPKVQFPSQYLCSKCHSKKKKKTNNPIEYNQDETIDFLLEYYSKKNIDTSLLSTERKDSSDHIEPIISRIEYIDQPSFFSRYSVYISIVILIILILIRRRYCQVKRERYIL